jgi:Domain of Unknown Function (DUF1259)
MRRAMRSRRGATRVLPFVLGILVTPGARGLAQGSGNAQWDAVGRILKSPPAPAAGYVRFNFPRRDITLRIGDVTVATAMASGTWAGFSGDPANVTMMGDLVLLAGELKPVLAELANQHIAVMAIHNHLAGESPPLLYVHYHADGNAADLAQRLDRVLVHTATPRPVTVAAPAPVTIDTALVFATLGLHGRAQGNVAQASAMLVNGQVTMDGRVVNPAMGYGTPVNIQMVSGNRAVATGDFSVLATKASDVVRALSVNGITATAMHTHLVGEQPQIRYIHFWADGPLPDVLRGLKAALDAARP